MKLNFLLIALAAIVFTSCSTAYKNGQTPDDVYYSPTKVITESTNNDNDTRQDDRVGYEERQIRMSAYDRRWRDLDRRYDYDYSYNPYAYGYNYGYYYNPYYYYSPVYFTGVAISNPKNTTPRMTSLGSYSNNGVEVINPKTGVRTSGSTYRTYNNSNSNGTYNRRTTISPSYGNGTQSRSSSSPSYNNNRTYSPSSSGSSSSGRSSSSGSSSGSSVPRNSRGN